MNRVVITGLGAISSIGLTVEETFTALRESFCGIGSLRFRNAERLSVQIGGQVKNFKPELYFSKQQILLYDKFTQFALIAAHQAISSSGVEITDENANNVGVILGSAGGGIQTQDDNYRQVYEEGKNRVHPLIVPKLMNNAAASHLSIKYNAQGPCYTVASACSSSNHAMGQALNLIRAGSIKIALTGGSESMLCFGGIKAWEGLRIMSKDTCRPFCATRDCMVQGEGAAIFVFEEYEHAKKRRAHIFAEVAGFSMSSDAKDIVNPNSEGASRAISGALADAKLNTVDIDYINGHGTGTIANDRTECTAIKSVFKEQAKNIMISSTKSMHGHLIGGTGALELLSCIMAIKEGIISPTINYKEKDPECDLDIVPNFAREKKVNGALSNSFAFGGLNAVLALKKLS
ncbi:MAG: beta-ketoacyl-[acyl-carrier-protein] synthase family protein [Pseudomonadota bacterium]|nr:beta-ketoacyl-[acyl-carrier-protein] synthase family protein [Pseudomonadota bacterium]